MAKQRKKSGPKTRYSKAKAEKARQMVSDGFSMGSIAKSFGITESCLYQWRNKYEYLEKMVQEGIEEFERRQEDQVRKSFYRKMHGYEYQEKKRVIEKGIDKKTGKEIILSEREEIINKKQAPDTTLLIFEKKSRDPRYREQKDINLKSENLLVSLGEEDLEKVEQIRKMLADGKFQD